MARNPNTTSDIRPHSEHTTSHRNQGALATRTPTRRQGLVVRVQRPTKDVIVRIRSHHRLRHIRLAVEDGTELQQQFRECRVLGRRLLREVHHPGRRVDPRHLETILERDRESPEWRQWFIWLCGALCIELFRARDRRVEEDLGHAVRL